MKLFIYSMRTFDELPIAERMSAETGVEFGWSQEYPSLANAHLAQGCDAVSAPPCTIDRPLLEAFAALGVRFYVTYSIGVDHIDLQAAKDLGIRVSNVAYPPNGVANYAIMMMLMCLRRMPYIQQCAAVQDFTLLNKVGRDISRCTVGVIGTGSIGSTVIRHLSGFGCRLLAYDIYPREGLPCEYVDLKTLFAECDVITLHAPATADNYHMINAETISTMKDGVVIVNTARGKLIDTDALIDGLRTKKIGAAALDVMEHEDGLYYANRMYDIIDNPRMAILRSFPNVILSPHTAFYTDENIEAMTRINFESVVKLCNGEPDPHSVI